MGAIAEGIVEFARPLIDATDGSHEELEKALLISQLCFNLALCPQDKREEGIRAMRPSMEADDEGFEEFRNVVAFMIERHERMFPLMHRKRHQASPPEVDNPPHWNRQESAVPAEKKRGIDRYAPCPCNSGKKYKFCCGKSGG